jgi:hypothetical protein
MNRREAKHQACAVIFNLIESYLSEGQPDMDCEERVHGWSDADAGVLDRAFREMQDEMARRGGLGK